MRKRFVLAFALALAIGCGGGGSNTPATPTPTSTSTTTTSVLATTTRNYTSGGGQVPSNAPSNMTLNFQWSSGGAGVENVYKVTGTYTTPGGGGGAVAGTLGGAVDPLQAGGQFQGTLTATVNGLAPASACTAERAFSGPLGPQNLSWTGGNILRDCPGQPLSFSSLGMQRSDSTTTITTSTPSTTSTSTSIATTTTAPPNCAYSISPTSRSFDALGGSAIVTVTASPSGCTGSWTAVSNASWIQVYQGASGTGSGEVWYAVAANSSTSRTGTITIAAQTFTVNQAGK